MDNINTKIQSQICNHYHDMSERIFI